MIASHWPTDWVYLADSPEFVASIGKGLVTGPVRSVDDGRRF